MGERVRHGLVESGARTQVKTTMERRKFVIGLGALTTGTAAAVGSGAFTAAQISDRDADIEVSADDDALIQLIPGNEVADDEDGTVGDHRVGHEDGQLFISFDDDEGGTGTGINRNAYYQVGSVDDNELGTLQGGIDGGDFSGPNPLDDTLASDTSIEDDPAFVIRNESEDERLIELSYDETATPDEEEATGILGMFAPGATDDFGSGGAAVLTLDPADDGEVSDQTTAELPPGEEAFVALFIKTENVDTDDSYQGSLRVNAGEAARFEDDV